MSELDDWAEDHRRRAAERSLRLEYLAAMSNALCDGNLGFPVFTPARPYVAVGDRAIATELALGAAGGGETKPI